MKKKKLKNIFREYLDLGEQIYWSDTEDSPFHYNDDEGNPFTLSSTFSGEISSNLHFGGEHFNPYIESSDGKELPMCLFYNNTFNQGSTGDGDGFFDSVDSLQSYRNICNSMGDIISNGNTGDMSDLSINQTIACCNEINTAHGGINIDSDLVSSSWEYLSNPSAGGFDVTDIEPIPEPEPEEETPEEEIPADTTSEGCENMQQAIESDASLAPVGMDTIPSFCQMCITVGENAVNNVPQGEFCLCCDGFEGPEEETPEEETPEEETADTTLEGCENMQQAIDSNQELVNGGIDNINTFCQMCIIAGESGIVDDFAEGEFCVCCDGFEAPEEDDVEIGTFCVDFEETIENEEEFVNGGMNNVEGFCNNLCSDGEPVQNNLLHGEYCGCCEDMNFDPEEETPEEETPEEETPEEETPEEEPTAEAFSCVDLATSIEDIGFASNNPTVAVSKFCNIICPQSEGEQYPEHCGCCDQYEDGVYQGPVGGDITLMSTQDILQDYGVNNVDAWWNLLPNEAQQNVVQVMFDIWSDPDNPYNN